MKRYYYFSNTKLRFEEIKSFKKKLTIGIIGLTLLFGLIISTGYFYFFKINNPDQQVEYLKNQNSALVEKIEFYKNQFETINKDFTALLQEDQQLRLKVNLEPLTEEDYNFGVGGSVSDNLTSFSTIEVSTFVDSLDYLVSSLSTKIKVEKNNFEEISKSFELNKKLYEAIPAISPTNGPIGDRFGLRYHPILKVRRMHNGVDFLVNTGSKVYAPGGGIISFAGVKGGLGNTIIINHGFGYTSLYGHLSKLKVKKGQKIQRGDLIAYSGNSGRLTTGPHLHYEVRHNGIALNPRHFIYDDIKLFDYLAIKEKEVDKG